MARASHSHTPHVVADRIDAGQLTKLITRCQFSRSQAADQSKDTMRRTNGAEHDETAETRARRFRRVSAWIVVHFSAWTICFGLPRERRRVISGSMDFARLSNLWCVRPPRGRRLAFSIAAAVRARTSPGSAGSDAPTALIYPRRAYGSAATPAARRWCGPVSPRCSRPANRRSNMNFSG